MLRSYVTLLSISTFSSKTENLCSSRQWDNGQYGGKIRMPIVCPRKFCLPKSTILTSLHTGSLWTGYERLFWKWSFRYQFFSSFCVILRHGFPPRRFRGSDVKRGAHRLWSLGVMYASGMILLWSSHSISYSYLNTRVLIWAGRTNHVLNPTICVQSRTMNI